MFPNKALTFIPEHAGSFEGMYNDLSRYLDIIKSAAVRGKTNAFRAYSQAYSGDVSLNILGAKVIIALYVGALSSEQLNFFTSLGFSPNDVMNVKVDAIINSVLFAWDNAASKFIDVEPHAETARAQLRDRLREFDQVLISQGKLQPNPD